MFELLPGPRLLLPHGAGTLSFGMGEQQAQWALSTLCDVRPGWVCGTAWACSGEFDGVRVLMWGALEEPHTGGLEFIEVARIEDPPRGPCVTPFAWDGIDLLGYPQHEIAPFAPDEVELSAPAVPEAYVRAVRLGAGRRRSARPGR
ncbi:hypothetical protein [Streptomyces sp. NPDC002187]|uniref:hypothetical protein n=1 Tax=Streptomyces sp. NPDC002187 TaxID=3364637 RepID=UPI0036A2E82C